MYEYLNKLTDGVKMTGITIFAIYKFVIKPIGQIMYSSIKNYFFK